MKNPSTPRRDFLKTAGKAAAGITILKAGSARTYAANEKLDLAFIGAGGRANADLKELSSQNVVALCDVDWSRAAGSFRKYAGAKRFKDYRKMLEEINKEVDGVVVATPDHHHFHASMTALKYGKNVYCEKPLTHTIQQARILAETARKAGVATQMGNQAQADEATRVVQEFVMDNAVGPIREAHVWTDRPSKGLFGEYWPQAIERPQDTPPAPGTLDWNLWLGPAPERSYNPAYLPFKWRGWWDFGTGALGDIGCHFCDPVFRALKLGSPSTVEAASTRVNTETYPVGSMITYEFPARGDMPALKLVWYDGGLRPARPDAVDQGVTMGANGLLLVGDDGYLSSDWSSWKMSPEKKAKEYGAPPKKLERSKGHHQEWIDACKGGPKAGSNFDWAGPLTEAVLLGTVALRSQLREKMTKTKLHWDAKNMKFTGFEEADQFVGYEYRKGWEV